MVESTISGLTYLKYANMAKEAGFRTVFIYVALNNADMSAQRIEKRVGLGGHAIPLRMLSVATLWSMNNIKVFINAFESAHIYDNSEHYKWVAGLQVFVMVLSIIGSRIFLIG